MNHHDTATLKKREIFTSIATNKQSNAGTATSASMLPNDEVYYPKLNLGNQCTSLDNLWMVGFLHHDKKSKEKKVNGLSYTLKHMLIKLITELLDATLFHPCSMVAVLIIRLNENWIR